VEQDEKCPQVEVSFLTTMTGQIFKVLILWSWRSKDCRLSLMDNTKDVIEKIIDVVDNTVLTTVFSCFQPSTIHRMRILS
jgi:hypothetical protein